MPLPMSLLPVFKLRDFWTVYMEGGPSDEPFPGLADSEIRLDVSPEAGLVLALDEDLFEQTLYLRHGQLQKPVQIAWDDSSHWHPHVLRWAELEAICRAVSINDSSLPHPGLPLLLLYRLAFVTVGDDATIVFQTIGRAWRALDLFSDDEVAEFSRRYDYRAAGFVWRPDDERGWLTHQDDTLRQGVGYLHDADLYTLRLADNPDLPFLEFI